MGSSFREHGEESGDCTKEAVMKVGQEWLGAAAGRLGEVGDVEFEGKGSTMRGAEGQGEEKEDNSSATN